MANFNDLLVEKQYSDLLKTIKQPIGTKILPVPTVSSASTSIQRMKRYIGGNTLSFIVNNRRFDRCIGLLLTSQALIDGFRGKIMIVSTLPRSRKEYSYAVAPAAKALEGFLLAIALSKGMIGEDDLDDGIQIGRIYDDINGKPALAKSFVLKGKDKRLVDKIYSDWGRYRNKTLHYDEDFFVNTTKDAEDCVRDIYGTIKLAYQIFLGSPN